MRNFTIYLAAALCLFVSKMTAQENTFNERVKVISAKIDNVTKQEKEALKREVESVNVELEEGKISAKEAEEKKKVFALKRADNIEQKVALYEQELKDLIQLKANGKLADKKYKVDTLVINGKKYPATVEVIDDTEFTVKKGKITLIPGDFDGEYFEVSQKRSPGMVSVLNSCNSMICIDNEVEKLEKNSLIKILPINWKFFSDIKKDFLTHE